MEVGKDADRDTALLMSDFFDGLVKGKTKAEALREVPMMRKFGRSVVLCAESFAGA
jgi:hypothetical protein